MRSAHVSREHSAYGAVMQAAYACRMSDDLSPRQRRRQQKLIQLLVEVGGPTQAAIDTGTQRSHFSALKAGSRGLGDELAAKLERVYKKPEGWFDEPESNPWPFSAELRAAVAQLTDKGLGHLEEAMWVTLSAMTGDVTKVIDQTQTLQTGDELRSTTPAPTAVRASSRRALTNAPRLGIESAESESHQPGQLSKSGGRGSAGGAAGRSSKR